MNSSFKTIPNLDLPRWTCVFVSACDRTTVASIPTSDRFFSSRATESSKGNRCLICSIIPSLSNTNCCAKHLTLLTTLLTSKRSSPLKHQKRKQWEMLQSSDSTEEDEDLLSSKQSTPNLRKSSDHIRHSQSSSLNNMNSNNNQTRTSPRQKKVFASSPYVTRNRKRSTESTSLEPCHSPRIFLNRIIHVKDEGEEYFPSNSSATVSMAQATEQMLAEEESHPKIYLKRVCLE